MRTRLFEAGARVPYALRGLVRSARPMRLCLLATGCFFAATASAHHSFAAYDQAVTRTVTGALKEFDWNAPHSGVTVVFQNENGTTAEVSVTTGAPSTIANQGFKAKDFKVGNKVTMSWHPNRNGSPGGELVELKLEDGRVLRGGFPKPPGDQTAGAPGASPAGPVPKQ